jgi:hypothetical protein
MKTVAIILSVIGLLLTITPSFLHFFGQITWARHAQLMFAGMIVWFVFAPIWYFRKKKA